MTDTPNAHPESKTTEEAPQKPRRLMRFFLLFVLPLVVAVAGGWLYLQGGRYVSTDNAYIGAQKVLVTPEISGKVAKILVEEGQKLKAGDELFEIDATPYRIAANEAKAHLAKIAADFKSIKASLSSIESQIVLQKRTLELRLAEQKRKSDLLANRVGSRADLEASEIAVTGVRAQIEQLEQQRNALLTQLQGDPALPVEQYAPWMEAKAALDRAERNLEQTVLRAPIAGVATQVSSIQMGRYLQAGAAVFSIIADQRPWIDANLKETDLANVHSGQNVEIDVDAYPGRSWRGHVVAISPGTGAQFAILPPQNASGNWVKVVQRVPVRIEFDANQNLSDLRAGMSANVAIETGAKRTLAGLLGLGDPAHAKEASAAR